MKVNRYIIYTFLILISLLFIRGLDPTKSTFWIDNNSLFGLVTHFQNFMYLWTENLLGNFTFSVPTSLPNYLINFIFLKIAGFNLGTYLLQFSIVLFTITCGFLLSSVVLKNDIIALLFCPIFIFNPIFLYNFYGPNTLTILTGYLSVVLVLFLFEKYKEANSGKYLVLIVFASLLSTHPFAFFFLSGTIFWLLVSLKKYKESALLMMAIFVTHLFWILPFLSSFIYKSVLLGSYTTSLVQVYAALGKFMYSFVFLGRSFDFLKNFNYPLVAYSFFVIIWVALIYFSFISVRKLKPEILFLWVLILFLLFFSAGPGGELGLVYRYMFDNFSWFSFFRSYQNVFITLCPIVLYLLMLVGKLNKKEKYLAFFSLFAVFFFSLTANDKFLRRSTDFPSDYFNVQKIVNSDLEEGSVLILPLSVYDFYKWDTSGQDKYFLEQFFSKPVLFYRPTFDNNHIQDLFNKIYYSENYEEDLRNFSVRYVMVRKDLVGHHTPFIKNINLQKVYSSENVDLYLATNPAKLVEAPENSKFTKISPVHYHLDATLAENDNMIGLRTKYNSGWRIYILPNTENSNLDWNFFKAKSLSLPRLYGQYGNMWEVNPRFVVNNFPGTYYKVNESGDVHVKLVIYFIPQLYYYVGLIVSFSFLFYLIVAWFIVKK